MGRVEYYWKEAFERAGFTFIHIGPDEVGPVKHKGLFPYKAYSYYKSLGLVPSAFIVHEPAAGVFTKRGIPCFVESHGIERKFWEKQLSGDLPSSQTEPISLKTRILFPLWRLRNCDIGLKRADKLLLINTDDSVYVQRKYKRSEDDIFIFKNGITKFDVAGLDTEPSDFTVLFNGTWIDRKGIHTLIDAAVILEKRKIQIRYLLIGTSKDEKTVLADWPETLHSSLKVVPRFESQDEVKLLSQASVFVLPSFSEGQPLSLLQAMAVGKCCITTNCCGQKDLITSNEDGLLFEPGDAEALAEMIEKCYVDTSRRKEIGNNARLLVQNRSWHNVADEVVEIVVNYMNTSSKK
ncbi:glycosyltransferase family 4 protein [Flavobacterium sp.]|uniref:glycosyltransferase family 4 protein n=1 Tax=Flavobacterium sp. TaxID=239 RepID=UPI0025BD868F|nr:glycosyltransferase family 4 protein [Flavobacterium sp.]